MWVQQVKVGGRDSYIGAVTLSFLRRIFQTPSPSNLNIALFSEKEAKTINEIAKFIVDQVSKGQSWWMGGLSFEIYPFPHFEPFSLGKFESEISDSFGTLLLSKNGSETWIPLDGNLRLIGMLKALSILSGEKRMKLAEDAIPVILLPYTSKTNHEETLLRMHKSARAVDKGEIIRTTVNDKYAIYARWLMGDDKEHPAIIPNNLVNWKSNTLTNRLRMFTTLSVLYDSVRMLDLALGPVNSDNSSNKDERYKEIADIWHLLLESFTHFHEAVYENPNLLPSLREQFLCLKPTGQLVVIAVIAKALQLDKEVPLKEVIKRLNAIPWQTNDPLWRNIIVFDGRINGTGRAITLTSRLIAHIIGLPLSDAEIQDLEQDYRRGKQEENATLPEPLFPSWV